MTKQYKDITYDLRRAKRKTGSIYIERDGRVTVIVPEALAKAKIEDILERKRPQIYKGLAERAVHGTGPTEKQFVTGESFYYLGRPHRLRLVSSQRKQLVFEDNEFNLQAKRSPAPRTASVVAFSSFYREQAKPWLAKRVAYFAPKLGFAVPPIKVLELRTHWASLSKTGALNFNWRVMMVSTDCIDYLIVHELTHLKYPTHSETFWAQVGNIIRDYRDRRSVLKHFSSNLFM
jgi:predicted metal-dependent hydrolase